MLEVDLAANALTVDVRAVQAAEIPQNELTVALLEDAVLFRDDLVEELNRVVRVTAEAVRGPKVDELLSFGSREDQLRHETSMVARFRGGRTAPTREPHGGAEMLVSSRSIPPRCRLADRERARSPSRLRRVTRNRPQRLCRILQPPDIGPPNGRAAKQPPQRKMATAPLSRRGPHSGSGAEDAVIRTDPALLPAVRSNPMACWNWYLAWPGGHSSSV